MPKHLANHWLPCKKEDTSSSSFTNHFQKATFITSVGTGRRLLAEASGIEYCDKKGKVPLLSITALHHLHIFIFVLAIVHVTFCVLTIIFGGAKIRQWKRWEDAISKREYDPEEVLKTKFTHVQDNAFIKGRFRGVGKSSTLLGWLHSFFKQFYASVNKTDYTTLRLGFIMTHCRGNPKFNFHKYMIRALEADFKKVVGISWYLWLFVIVFLLLNVSGWHAYFWISFIPFIVQYSFDSCIMGQVGYMIPRLVIGAFVQFLCSYSTLPLYAIVTQMGSSFKKAIFEERIQDGLVGWAQKARKNKGVSKEGSGSSHVGPKAASPVTGAIQMAKAEENDLGAKKGNDVEIQAANASKMNNHLTVVP